MKIPESVRKEIEQCVERRGAVVVEWVARGSGKNPLIEIFVDSEEGVTLHLCRDLSREIQGLLDGGLPDARYSLTVSSPGLERPLVYPWQFRKHVGRTFEVVIAAHEERRTLEGKLVALSDQGIVLEETPAGGVKTIPFADILKATVRTPW